MLATCLGPDIQTIEGNQITLAYHRHAWTTHDSPLPGRSFRSQGIQLTFRPFVGNKTNYYNEVMCQYCIVMSNHTSTWMKFLPLYQRIKEGDPHQATKGY